MKPVENQFSSRYLLLLARDLPFDVESGAAFFSFGCEVLMFRRHIKQHEPKLCDSLKQKKIGNIREKSFEIRYMAPDDDRR